MQPLCLHGRCVHVALVGGIVEDLEFRLWGQLQTDVTHQDADNGKGTCGAPPSQQKSEVCSTPMEMTKGSNPGTLYQPIWMAPYIGLCQRNYQQPHLSCHRHFPRSYTSLLTVSHWTPTQKCKQHGPEAIPVSRFFNPILHNTRHLQISLRWPARICLVCIAYGISCSVAALCSPSWEEGGTGYSDNFAKVIKDLGWVQQLSFQVGSTSVPGE